MTADTAGDPNPRLEAGWLVLTPLTPADADEMFGLLGDPALYRYLDEPPPATLDALRRTYARREARCSPDGRERWLNWVVRRAGTGSAIGYVQATLDVARREAWIAYVFAAQAQGRGLATAATGAMIDFLERRFALRCLLASVDAQNRRSVALLERLGFALASASEHVRTGRTEAERLYLRPGRVERDDVFRGEAPDAID